MTPTEKIRSIAKRLHDAAKNMPPEPPHYLDLATLAYALTEAADRCDEYIPEFDPDHR